MQDHRCLDIARIVGKKGLEGKLVIRMGDGFPFCLQEGMTLALVPPLIDVPRRVVIEGLRRTDELEAIVAFGEVTEAVMAERMVGMHCLISHEEAHDRHIQREEGYVSESEYIGWTVVDVSKGPIGEIVEILTDRAQPLMSVRTQGGDMKLIPFVEGIIVETDPTTAALSVDCPSGLLDL